MELASYASSVLSSSEDGPAAQSVSASEGVEKRNQVEVLDKVDVVAMTEEAAKDGEDDNSVRQIIKSTETTLCPLGKCHEDKEKENGRSNTLSHSEIVSDPPCNIYESIRLIGKSDSVDSETFVDPSNVIEGRALDTDDSLFNNELISSPLQQISKIEQGISKPSVENSNRSVQDCSSLFSSHSEDTADSCQSKLPALQSAATVVVAAISKQELLHEVLVCAPTTAVTDSQDDHKDSSVSSGPREQNAQGLHVAFECEEKQDCANAKIHSSDCDAVEGRSNSVVDTVTNEAYNTTVASNKTEVAVSASIVESVVSGHTVTHGEENQGPSEVGVAPRTQSSSNSSGVEIEKTATRESKLDKSVSKVTIAAGSRADTDDEKEEGELEEGELDDDEEEEGKARQATPVVPVKAAAKATVEGNSSEFEQANAVMKSATATKKASEVPKPSEKSNVIVSDEKSGEEGAKEDKKRKIEEDSDKNSKKKKKKHHHYDSEEDSDEAGAKFRGRRTHADPSDFDAMLQLAMHRRGGPGGAAAAPASNSGDDYLDEMDPFSPPGIGRGPFRPGFEGAEGEEGGRSKRRQGGPGGRWSPPQPSSKTEALCVHFLEGTCTKGNECQYSHNVNHRVGQMHQKKMELCKFYLMGCCAKRQKCLYMHKDFPCKRYHTGIKCDPADKCKFSHEPLSGITRNILLKHLESAPKDILGKFPRLSKVAAHYVVLVTEAYRNRQPIDIEKMPGLRDWKSMGFKYVDRALRSYDKAHGKRSRKDPRPDGTAYSDSPDEDPTAINPSILLNPNHMPLNPNYMLMNPNHMPINPNHMSMNSNHMSMNSNHMSMNPNHIPLNPNHMSMNPNLMPVNPNKIPLLALPSQPTPKGGCDSDDDPNNPDILTRNRLLLELSKEDALENNRRSGGGSDEEEAAEERRHRKKGRKRHRSDRGEGAFEVEDAPGHKRRYESHQRNRHRSSRKERRDSRHGESGPRLEEGDETTVVASLLGGEEQTKQPLDDREKDCGIKNERKEEVDLDSQQKATENINQFPPGQHSDDEPALRLSNLEGSEQQPSQHQAKGRIAEYKERRGYQEDWYSSDDDVLDSSGVSDGKSPRLMMDLPPETKAMLPHGGISALLDSARRAQSATNTSTPYARSIGSPTPSATQGYERDGGHISSSDEGNYHGRPSSVNANEDFSHLPRPTSMTTNVSPSSSTSIPNRKSQSLSHTHALSPPGGASSAAPPAAAAAKPEPPKKYDPFEMFRQQQQNELLKYREQQEKERLQKQQLQQGDQQQHLQSPNQQHSRNPSLDSVSPPGSSSGHSQPDRRNASSPLPPVEGHGPYHHDDRTFEPASSSEGFYDRGPYSGNQSPLPTRVGYVSYSRDKDPESPLHTEGSYGGRDQTGSPQLALRSDKKDSPMSSPVPPAITTPSAPSKPAGLPGGFFNLNFNNINVPSDLAKVLSDLKNNTKMLSKGATPSTSANSGQPSTSSAHPNKDALADKPSGLNLSTDAAARPLSSRDPATYAAERPLTSRDPASDAAARPSLSRDPRRLRAQRDSTESRDSADSSGRDPREGSLAGHSDSREMLLDPREFRDFRDRMEVRESRDPRQNRDMREDQRDPWGLSREPPFPTGQSSLPERRDPRTIRDPRLSKEASIESGAGRPMDNPLLRDRRRSNSDSDSRNSDPTCDIDLEHLDVPIAGFVTSSSLPFHVPIHEPATIVNGSITSHPPMVYKLLIVTIPDVSYANVTRGLTKDDVRVKEDPRLYRMFYGLEEPPRVSSPKSATVVYDDPESPPPASAQEPVVPSPAIDRRDPRMNRDPRVAADPRTVNPNKLGVSVDIKSKDPRIQSQNQDPRSQNQDPRTQNQDPRSVIPDTRSMIPDPRSLNPDPRTVNPDIRSLNQDPRAPILDPRHSLSLNPPIDSPMPGSDPRNPYLKTMDLRNNDPRLEGRGADPRLGGGRADPRLGVGTSRDPRAIRTMEEDPSSSLDPRHRPCILGHHPHGGVPVSQYGPPQGLSTLTSGGHMPTAHTPHPMGMLPNAAPSAQNGLPPNMPNPGMAPMHHGGQHSVYPGPMMAPHDMVGGAPRPMNPYMNYGNMGPGVPGGFMHSPMNNDPNMYPPNMMHEGPPHMYHGDMGGGGGHGGRGHPNNRYYHSRKNKNPYRGGGGNKNDPRLNKNLETQASFSPPPPVV